MDYKDISFIIAGPGKTGSFWLAQCLREHPQLFTTPETNYLTHYRHEGSGYLDRQFNGRKPGDILGEYANWYLSYEAVAAELYGLNPELKIIVCVRDPVARAVSAYRHDLRWGTVGRHIDLRSAMSDDFFERRYIDAGRYSEHLRRYAQIFPPEQVFLFTTSRTVDEKKRRLHELFRFLGVEPADVPSLDTVQNKTVSPLVPELHRMTLYAKTRTQRAAARLVDPLNVFLGERLLPYPVSDDDLERLKETFRALGEKQALADLINEHPFAGSVDFSKWTF